MGRVQIDSKATEPSVQRSLEKLASELSSGLNRLDALRAEFEDAFVPDIGTPFPWFGGAVPSWALLLDGSAVSRATYADLFSLWGTTYGAGDGSTTFGLPDARGRVLVGQAASGTFGTLAATGGEETHTLTESELPAHGHDYNWFVAYVSGLGIASGTTFQGSNDVETTTETGGDGAHNNLQPYLVIKGWIVRAL